MRTVGRGDSREFSRGEIIQAYVFLSVFAAVFAFVGATYLTDLWLPLAWVLMPLATLVLTRTAALWTSRRIVWLVPLAVWCAVWVIFAGGWALVAGLVGGVWPLARAK